MTLYITYSKGVYYYARKLNGEAKPVNPRKYTERQFKDFCATAQMKGDNIINLPSKPTPDLEKMLKKEYARITL